MHTHTQTHFQDSVASLPSEKGQSLVGGAVLLTQVLRFLAAMLQDLAALRARLRAASLDPVLISVCLLHILVVILLMSSHSYVVWGYPHNSISCGSNVIHVSVLVSCCDAGAPPHSGRNVAGEDLESLHSPHSQVSMLSVSCPAGEHWWSPPSSPIHPQPRSTTGVC